MSFHGADATMVAPSDPSDAIDLAEMIKKTQWVATLKRQRSMSAHGTT